MQPGDTLRFKQDVVMMPDHPTCSFTVPAGTEAVMVEGDGDWKDDIELYNMLSVKLPEGEFYIGVDDIEEVSCRPNG